MTGMEWIHDPQAWIALGTLTALEIVLGIDNVVFISILAGKLPPEERGRARLMGLGMAMGMRILLLLSLSWMMRLTQPFLHLAGRSFSGRDLILVVGGAFLVGKATVEIHERLEGEEGHHPGAARVTLWAVLIQIILMDVIFSLDSVITALGMAEHLAVMVAAVVISVAFMMLFHNPVGRFIDEHPTLKVLALSFLLLVGFTLVIEGWGVHVPKGYIYSAMAFSLFVEMLNLKMHKRRQPLRLRRPFGEEGAEGT